MPKVSVQSRSARKVFGTESKHDYASTLVKQLTVTYARNCNNKKALRMKHYLKDQFDFYGLYAPERRAIDKLVLSNFDPPTLKQLKDTMALAWRQRCRECQLFAIDFGKTYKHLLAGDDAESAKTSLTFLRMLVTTKSWWDTIDLMAPTIIGHVVYQHRSECLSVMEEWISSDNFWLRRCAIIHQLNYKHDTDTALLYDYCLQCAGEEELFIQRAIGWALRECHKTFRKSVKAFIEENREQLSILSINLAQKYA